MNIQAIVSVPLSTDNNSTMKPAKYMIHIHSGTICVKQHATHLWNATLHDLFKRLQDLKLMPIKQTNFTIS